MVFLWFLLICFFLFVWAGLAWGLRGFDSSRPDQEFGDFVGPRLKFAVFSSLRFVAFVVYVGLIWPGL